MNAIEFSGKIKKGKIEVPKELQDSENESVRVILLFDNVERLDKKKNNLLTVLNKMKTEKMFSNVENPVFWQKNIRNEWE